MSDLSIVALPGDGVGPEVTAAVLQVLEAIADRFGHALSVDEYEVGYSSWARHGTSITEEAVAACRGAGAVFLGAVGDPRADSLPPRDRPERALLRLRGELGCFANLRPARIDPSLVDTSVLRPQVVEGCDFVIVRELTGGLYYGTPRREDDRRAINTLEYTSEEIERVARVAFELARSRRGHVTSVDKANVLEVSRLWRRVVGQIAREYPDVTVEHMLVDRAAMELVLSPTRFDVLLTENMFGDILSDEAAAVCGTLGVLGSASVGGQVGLYEPVHGSAPDIAGRNVANPIGAIASGALMLSHSFGLQEESRAVDAAISQVLASGLRTADLARNGVRPVGTAEFTNAVVEELR